MTMNILFHLAYLVLTIPIIIWVGNRLHTHGAQFVIDAFHGDETRGRAVNHLLLIGFYLINMGLMALLIRFGARPDNALKAIEHLVTKLGIVLLVLGGMHYYNLFNFDRMRRKGKREPRKVEA